MISTLPSFNELLKYNDNNQVLVREIRLSPDVNDTCVLLGFDLTQNINLMLLVLILILILILVPYRRFGTTYRSHPQGQGVQE